MCLIFLMTIFSIFVNYCCGHGFYYYGPPSPNGYFEVSKMAPSTPQESMVDFINLFGLKLLAIHNEQNPNNIAFSPYGAASILIVLGEGLRGDAILEIRKATHLHFDEAIIRVGLRDIHRHLKSYFIPHEGFLAGLTLNNDNITLNSKYADILRFYGFDLESFNSALYPEQPTTIPPYATTTTTTTTISVMNDEGLFTTTELIKPTDMSKTTTTAMEETTTQQTTTTLPETTTSSPETTIVSLETTSLKDQPTTSITTPQQQTTLTIPETTTISILTTTENNPTTLMLQETTTVVATTTLKSETTTTPSLTTTLPETTVISTLVPETTTLTFETTQQPLTMEQIKETTTILPETTTLTTAKTQEIPTTTTISAPTTIPTTPLFRTTQQTTTTRRPNPSSVIIDNKSKIKRNDPDVTTTFKNVDETTTFDQTKNLDETTTTNFGEITTNSDETTTFNQETTFLGYKTTQAFVNSDTNIETTFLDDLGKTTTKTTRRSRNERNKLKRKPYSSRINSFATTTDATTNSDETTTTTRGKGLKYHPSVTFGTKGARRSKRSLHDFILARYYDSFHPQNEHLVGYPIHQHNIQQTTPYTPKETLYFLVNGQYKEANIKFMTYDTVLPYFYLPQIGAAALRFPLDSPEYFLLILLPLSPTGVDDLICSLQINKGLKFVLQNLKYTHVKAIIPNFSLKGFVVLTPTLQKLGIHKIFEPRQADFGPMTTDKDTYVTNIEQAITVNIRNYVDPNLESNYEGNLQQTEPVEFKVDHPFLYFVVDSQLNLVLMAGKIVNPLNSRVR